MILHPIPMPSVYVITGGPKHVKIGISTNLEGRISGIQTGCPFPVRLVQAWETREARKIEARAHNVLGKYRAAGEWFSLPANIAVQTVSALVEKAEISSLVFCGNCTHSKLMTISPNHATTFRCSRCDKRDRVHVIDF